MENKKLVYNKNKKLVYNNGRFYLAKNLEYSTQFIGCGNSIALALLSMDSTIRKHNLKKLNA